MVVFNYTKVKRREKRVYSLFNTTISRSGWSVNTLQTCGIFLAIFSVFGIAYCIISGTFWYNPITIAESSAAGYFYIVFVFTPIGIGVMLNSCKVQNYKAIDYLKIYFKPRIPLDQNGKRVKLDGYKQNTFIERI